jgi:hypothetical protein
VLGLSTSSVASGLEVMSELQKAEVADLARPKESWPTWQPRR